MQTMNDKFQARCNFLLGGSNYGFVDVFHFPLFNYDSIHCQSAVRDVYFSVVPPFLNSLCSW